MSKSIADGDLFDLTYQVSGYHLASAAKAKLRSLVEQKDTLEDDPEALKRIQREIEALEVLIWKFEKSLNAEYDLSLDEMIYFGIHKR